MLLTGGISGTAEAAGLLREKSLTPRSGPRGATMFTEMAPTQTGVLTENNYADPAMWRERYHEFDTGPLGTGVTVGDYDNDGRPDIFVVSKTESCRLFRNLGNWKFEDVTDKAGLGGTVDAGLSQMKNKADNAVSSAWRQGATFVDVNNDGWLDLYVCRFGAPNLLYINQGDGGESGRGGITFKEEAAARGLALNDASSMAAFCDYDRDGWLDVYVQTNVLDGAKNPTGQRDHLYRNNCGTFTEVTDQAGITGETQGHSATWWDYDNDGWPDLYVANDFAVPDQLYHNNHDGAESDRGGVTFTNTIDRTVPHAPFSAMGADQGDVNNDGLIDFLVADMATTSHEKDHRSMAGSRSHNQDPTNPLLAPQYPRNALYLNTGTGHALEAAFLTGLDATDWSWSLRFEDLDNDGRLDLHITNGMVREIHNLDLLNQVMMAETAVERIKIVKASPVFAETHLAYRNLGDLKFESAGHAWGLDQKGVSFGSAFGDFDGDGDLDLVYANYQAGVTVLRNDSDSGHRVIFDLRGTLSNRFGVGATVRIESDSGIQVRQLVLARGYLSSSEPMLHFGLGNDTLIKRVSVSWPSGHEQHFENLSADRRFTITEPSTPSTPQRTPPPPVVGQFTEVSQAAGLAFTSRETLVEETVLQPLLPFRHNRSGPSLAIGDLNGDGSDDIWLGGTALDPARSCSVPAQGISRQPTIFPSPPHPR